MNIFGCVGKPVRWKVASERHSPCRPHRKRNDHDQADAQFKPEHSKAARLSQDNDQVSGCPRTGRRGKKKQRSSSKGGLRRTHATRCEKEITLKIGSEISMDLAAALESTDATGKLPQVMDSQSRLRQKPLRPLKGSIGSDTVLMVRSDHQG